MRLEEFTEFIGADVARQATDEEPCARCSALAPTASAAALSFKAEVGTLSTVFTHISSDEGGSARRSFGKHGFGSGAPALAGVVESACTLVEFRPSGAVIVCKGTVGLVATGRALDVPVAIEFGLKSIATWRTDSVQNTAVVSLSEIKTNDRLDLLDDGTTDVSSS